MTMGQYDGVGIVEVPNDEAGAKLALTAASQGDSEVKRCERSRKRNIAS
jgi:uncharacterized protein with GYD domain